MPTPMPIIAANCGVKVGMSTKDAPTPIMKKPETSARSAVTIGSPIATTEPKAMSKMMIAAARPISSALPGGSCSAKSTTRPPAST